MYLVDPGTNPNVMGACPVFNLATTATIQGVYGSMARYFMGYVAHQGRDHAGSMARGRGGLQYLTVFWPASVGI